MKIGLSLQFGRLFILLLLTVFPFCAEAYDPTTTIQKQMPDEDDKLPKGFIFNINQ